MPTRKRPARKRPARNPRDRFAMTSSNGSGETYTPMTPKVSAFKAGISFQKFKNVVRNQIVRFSADPLESDARITPQEAMMMINANESRVKEAFERGIPSFKVAKNLMI